MLGCGTEFSKVNKERFKRNASRFIWNYLAWLQTFGARIGVTGLDIAGHFFRYPSTIESNSHQFWAAFIFQCAKSPSVDINTSFLSLFESIIRKRFLNHLFDRPLYRRCLAALLRTAVLSVLEAYFRRRPIWWKATSWNVKKWLGTISFHAPITPPLPIKAASTSLCCMRENEFWWIRALIDYWILWVSRMMMWLNQRCSYTFYHILTFNSKIPT